MSRLGSRATIAASALILACSGGGDSPPSDGSPDDGTNVEQADAGGDGGGPEDADTPSNDADVPTAQSGEHHHTYILTSGGPAGATDVAVDPDRQVASVAGILLPEATLEQRSSFAWGRPYGESTSDEFVQISDTSLGNSYGRAVGVYGDTGEPFLLAEWSGQAKFGDVTISNAESDQMMALVRYNTDGSVRWVEQAGHMETFGYGEMAPLDVVVDVNGTSVAVGAFSGTVDFGEDDAEPVTLDTGDLDNEDAFVAIYDREGQLTDAYARGGAATDRALSVATLPSGWCIAGLFGDTVDLGVVDDVTQLTSDGGSDGFLECFVTQSDDSIDPWVRHLASETDVAFTHTAASDDGDVWVAGEFVTEATLAAGEADEVMLQAASSQNTSCFVARFGPSGELVWHHVFASTEYVNCGGLAVDRGSGTAVWTGTFAGEITAGPQTHATAGGTDVAIAVFDADGTLLWTATVGGSGDDIANAAAIDPDAGYAFAAGEAAPGAVFGAEGPQQSTFDHPQNVAFLTLFAL